MSKICCFTGHRDISSLTTQEMDSRLENAIIHLIENEGVTDFRAGGAVGFDTFAALKVLKLKNKYPHVKLHLILPCKNQDKYFSSFEKSIYQLIIAYADTITYIQENYTKGVMLARNRALVDGAEVCLAYMERLRGGTYQTVNYARRNNVKVINLLKA